LDEFLNREESRWKKVAKTLINATERPTSRILVGDWRLISALFVGFFASAL
jgi:hypothetical protein